MRTPNTCDPAPLDAGSQARLSRFQAITRQHTTLDTGQLKFLSIDTAPQHYLKSGSYRHTNTTVTLSTDTTVITRQNRINAARVRAYIDALRAGTPIDPMSITDIGPSNTIWHLDGLHRLAAARILGTTLDAYVLR